MNGKPVVINIRRDGKSTEENFLRVWGEAAAKVIDGAEILEANGYSLGGDLLRYWAEEMQKPLELPFDFPVMP